MTDPLTRPLELRCGASLSNRLAKAAMTEGLADHTNRVTDAHLRLYRRWSHGGAGCLVSGNMMIDGRYLEQPGNVVIESEAALPGLRRLAAAGTEADNHFWVQLNHPGRQVNRFVSTDPVAPSAGDAVKMMGFFAAPRALTVAEIHDVIERFANSARLAQNAGFTGVEVHAAHGYLLSQFLSPRVNRRNDDWGGDLRRRARIVLETVRAVRAAVGDRFPIAVKLNSADFQRGGFSHEESMQVVEWLSEESVDLVEVSGGNYEAMGFFGHDHDATATKKKKASTRAREAYFLEYAAGVRERVGTDLPLMVTGGFRSREAMVHALETGACDVVGLARPLVLDPEFCSNVVNGLRDGLQTPAVRGVPGQMRAIAEASFYYENIRLLGDGLAPDGGLMGLRTTLRYLLRDVARARRWRRNRR